MHAILVEKPYKFVPPHRGDWWPSLIQCFDLFSPHLRKQEGVYSHEVRHADRLQASLAAGHGVLLTPNHPRTADPLVIGYLARKAHCNVFAMASWHLFNQNWFMSFAIRKMGAFSIYREGIDRQAINTAIDILDEAGSRSRIASMTRPPEIKGLEGQIEMIVAEKEASTKKQDFENAAALRAEEKIKRQ